MELQMPQIKFKEYTELNFLGNYGDYSPEKSNNRFPFLGYRAYSEEALPIIEKFSAEEFKFIHRVKESERSWLAGCYDKQDDGSRQLNLDIAGLEDQQRIWNLFRETPYISSYYRCLPYLLPDDSKAEVINNKYVYTFKQVKNGGFTSIYREFFVKEGKYYQSKIEREEITTEQEVISSPDHEVPRQHIATDSNQNNDSDNEPKLIVETVIKNEEVKYRYFMRENRTFSTSATKNISPPKKNGKVEYEYIYILSQVQLSLTRINSIRKEIEQGTCKRGARASFFDHADAYESFRRYASNFITNEADRVKNRFTLKYQKFFKKIPQVAHSIDMIAFMEKEEHLISHNYEDILYNGPYNQSDDSNHTVYLIDYQSYIWKLKTDFDGKVENHSNFIKGRTSKGYAYSELNILTELIVQTVKPRKNDTEEAQKFKRQLKAKLANVSGAYPYKIWKNGYDSQLRFLSKQIELSGGLLASAVDTSVFTDLNFDYYFLLKKTDVSEEDKELVEKIDDFSGNISQTLLQSAAGRMLLDKKVKTVNSNLARLRELKQQGIVDVTLIYDNFKLTGDWLTLMMTTFIRKITTGTANVVSSYISRSSSKASTDQIDKMNDILAFQKIKISKQKVPGKKGGGKRKHRLAEAIKKATSFSSNKMKGGGYKKNINLNDDILEVTVTKLRLESESELNTQKTKKMSENTGPKISKALSIIAVGVELWNLYSAYDQFSQLDNKSFASVESISLLGAITDTTTTILESSKQLTKVTPYLGIVSSSLDWHVSMQKSKDKVRKHDYDSAMFHQISASCSAGLIVCGLTTIALCTSTGAKAGSLLGIKGVIFGAIIGLIVGICDYLAQVTTDSDYERWFKYCSWGFFFGKGEEIPSFSDVSFKAWANVDNGITHQIQAFYQLFATPTMEIALKRVNNKVTELGVNIFPKCLNAHSMISISAKILSAYEKEKGYELTSSFINLYTEQSNSSANCGVETVKLGNNFEVEKVMVCWTDLNAWKKDTKRKWLIYCPDLTTQIEKYDDLGNSSDPYLEVELKLDLYGDQQTVVGRTQKFRIDWLSEFDIERKKKEDRYRG